MANCVVPQALELEGERPGRQQLCLDGPVRTVTLSRNRAAAELDFLLSRLGDDIEARVHIGPADKPLGLTLDNVEALPLATELGLRNGDILEKINGIRAEGLHQVTDTIRQFSQLKVFRLGIIRDRVRHTMSLTLVE